jgi:hypothetical protein
MNYKKRLFLLLPLLICANPALSMADDTIKGSYCYTYGDSESLKEVKELTKTLAIRNALESYRIFVISTTNVNNFELTNDLLQIITSGYLKNVRVLDHSEEGRKVCETIEANVSPQALENIIKKEVGRRLKKIESTGLDNNGFLKILRTREYFNGPQYHLIDVILKVQKEYTNISQNDFFKVCIDYYDVDGNELNGSCEYLFAEYRNKGQIATRTFTKLEGTSSYKVWLYKKGSSR